MYSIKMTSDAGINSSMKYSKALDWSGYEELAFSVYHPGYTNEIGWIGLYTDSNNYKIWVFDFAASWTEKSIVLSSTPYQSEGTLDLSNITSLGVYQQNVTTPGEDYYFDFFRGRSEITSDVIHPLSFIEHSVRDCPKLEFMAKGTWIPSRDNTIVIYDYLTSNGSTTADQIIFEGYVIDYELTHPRMIKCVSKAKSDLDEFRPNGVYNGDLDSNHIKTLIAECSYVTEGTIDATVGNTDNTFKGDKTFRTILNDWADKHLKHWYLSPTGALSFNDADVDSGAVLHYHKGTYNFRDDAIGSEPSGWSSSNGAGCTTTIISSFAGHKKVLKLYDSNNATLFYIFTPSWSAVADNSIDIWFSIDNIGTTRGFSLNMYEGATRLGIIVIDLDDLLYYDGDYKNIKLNCIVAGTLYHLKIVPDDSANTYDVYLDGVLEGNDLAYENNSITGHTRILFQGRADAGVEPYSIYIDALGIESDPNYNVGDNLKGDPFQCWNVKPKKHVDAINWVMLKGGIVAGTQISSESKDQNSIDELGPKIYKDTYAFITVEAQLLIAANNLRTREQLLPLAINLWSYEANRGLIQAGECAWFAQSKANPNVSPRQVIVNKIIYRFLSGHTNLQTTDGIAFKKDKDKALPQENSLLLQQ